MWNKRKILSFLGASLLVGNLTVAASSTNQGNTAYESYAGKVKILDVAENKTTIRTTEVEQADLKLSVPKVNVRSYRFADVYTEYWEGEETSIISWTDAQYVYPGDVVVTLESRIDSILLLEKQLEYERRQEGHQTQCALQEQQIQNKKDEVAVLSGTRKEIAKCELQKLETAYEAYLYQYQNEITPLKNQIDELSAQKQSIEIKAEKEGYLYVANRRLTSLTEPTVTNNEALFSIVTSRDCIYYAEGSYAVGTMDTDQTVKAVFNAGQMQEYGIVSENTDTAFFAADVLTDEILSDLCGFGNASTAKWRPSFSVEVPILEDAVLVPVSLVYLTTGKNLPEEMNQTGGVIGYQNEYYVMVYQSGTASRRYVRLGQTANNKIAILAGLEPGEWIVSQ